MSSRSEENVATCEDVACKVAAGANVEPDEPGSGSNSPMNSSSDDLAAPVTSESSTGAAGASERSEGGQGDVAFADGEGSCDDDHERGDQEIDDEDKQSRSDQDQLASCEGDSVSRHLETDGMTERDGDQDENREEGQRYDAGREKQVSKAWEPETDAGPEEHVEDQEREEQEAKALEPNIAEYSVENFEDVVLDKSKEEQGDKACKRDIDEGRMSEIKGELEIDEDGTKNVPHQQWTEEHAAAKKETDEAVEITVQKGDSVTADGEQTGQDDKEESDGAFQSFCDTSSNSDLSVDGDSQNEESEPEREDEEQEDVEEEKYFDADDESSSSSSSCDDQAVVPPAPGGSVAMAAISNHDDGILNLDPPPPPQPPQPERKPELFDQDQVRRFLREKENEVANTYRDNFTQLNQEKNDQLAKLEKSRSHVSKQLEEIQRLRSDLAKEKEHNVRMHRLTEDNVKMKEETTLRTHQLKAMGHKEMRENVMAEAKRSLQFYNFVNDVLQFDESQPDSQLVKMIGEQEQFLDKINNDPAPPSMSSSDQAVGKTRMFDVHRPAPVDYTTLLTEIHQALNQAAEAAQRSQEAKDEAERVAAAMPNPAEDMATTEADPQVEPLRFPHPPPPPPPPTNQLALIIEKVQELCPDLAPEELYASLEQLREVNSGTINGLSLERVLDFITDQLDHHDGEEGEGEEGVSACAICHEELQPDNPEASNGLSCCQDKVYHAFCITQWLEMNGRCPVCSREV